MPLDPPEVKVGLGRPRRNRRRDPHGDPKQHGKLTRHGREMICKTYHQLDHNKRTYPGKEKPISSASPTKRRRGRPRKEMVDTLHESEPTATPQRIRATVERYYWPNRMHEGRLIMSSQVSVASNSQPPLSNVSSAPVMVSATTAIPATHGTPATHAEVPASAPTPDGAAANGAMAAMPSLGSLVGASLLSLVAYYLH
ncbi:hypothetical protein Cgig2_017753 [Carnegiea gigantea]|uniref:Uncharacterized protein n=1 Tax=Carnegiea gigantea TaxID=171969 RepID=A0A9Q1QR13_9CARY|nr:hypothetical protein Cgig2_017753 [Carnegiea gigantea]